MSKNVDAIDRALLNLLQEDSQLSNAQIAEKANLTASTCWRRIKSLEESGVIAGYTVSLDPAAMGLTFEAIVHLQLDRHDSDGLKELSDALNTRPEVIECFATTGTADYHLRVLCSDIDAYNRFMDEVLFKNRSVRSAQTNVILRRITESGRIKL